MAVIGGSVPDVKPGSKHTVTIRKLLALELVVPLHIPSLN